MVELKELPIIKYHWINTLLLPRKFPVLLKNFTHSLALPMVIIRNTIISLKGGKNKKISDNVEKLTTVFDYHNTNSEESDCVYNTVTKEILPEKFAKVFLNHEQGGEKRLQEFTNDRIEGSISIWKSLRKPNYQPLIQMLNLSRQISMVRQLDLKKKEISCQD